MATERIPLIATPSQELTVQLGGQSCRIKVRQRRTGVFLDLYLRDVPIVLGVKAINRKYLIRGVYQGFTGDLFFIDTQGASDPSFEGLGTRWQLVWNSAA